VLVPEQSSGRSNDGLSDWANGRSESISADNAITAQIDEDPASRTAGLDNFTYFPFLGVAPLGLGSYGGGLSLYQPGFNSIYLPGYTYRPLLLGLAGLGLRTYLPGALRMPAPPRRIGLSPGIGTIGPMPRPVARPVSIRPAAPIGVRGGGHR